MSPMGRDFFLMNFVGALGILQMVAAYSSLRGMMFFPNRAVSAVVGFLALAGVFLWFFISKPRNLPDTAGGLSGSADAWIFCVSCISAILFTLLATSFLNRKTAREATSYPSGLDALKKTTFLKAFAGALRELWTRF